MTEINLLEKYPKTKRDLKARGEEKTDEIRSVARKFEKDFFDGDRKYGYGGFTYNSRFWSEVVKDFINYYDLQPGNKIFDIGSAKGFMLYDLNQAMPELILKGIDISNYAVAHTIKGVREFNFVGDVRDLSMYKDDEFDLVICINTVHNLPIDECKRAISEIQRIGKHAFITMDAWNTDEEKEAMMAWNLTAKTMMSVLDWKKLFDEVGYKGDYYWFMP
ncbi:class I SAM-dependent methyltransferase [Candidatus Woesearchaeota archaeon]|nr:class I SAM-dependent methyltransferase [Candidatus Woesearchaeota archaeon]MCF7900821.1 class I SAM-dependent methyltransferase [Candidatus Woesearchaeota archaeon]MCF8013123.1 class I SAM-dependent methyltransferase [Candidatus Woesearchaeota archaeon]